VTRLRKYGLTIVTMASVATLVLFFTGWGSAVAANVSDVFVTNDNQHAVPVSLQTPPVIAGGSADRISGGSTNPETTPNGQPVVATALDIHLAPSVDSVQFLYGTKGAVSALFLGPDQGGNARISLDLAHPIAFDRILCADANHVPGECNVSWVGNQQ
jgi:hypothetical protein